MAKKTTVLKSTQLPDSHYEVTKEYVDARDNEVLAAAREYANNLVQDFAKIHDGIIVQ